MVKDKLGNEVKVGDTIAIAVLQWKSAHIRVGKIDSFTEAGNVRYTTINSGGQYVTKGTKEFIKIN